jgi:uncharacterized protein
VNAELSNLIDLQALDTRIASLAADAARLPREIAAVHAAVDEAKQVVEAAKAKLDAARKSQRAKEKDLEDNRVKRQKFEGQLYQVKTNKEYSAVLAEIESLKVEKGRIEEESLGLMETQERMTREIGEAEGRLKRQERESKAQGRRRQTSYAPSRPTWPSSVSSGSPWPGRSPGTCSPSTPGS